MELGGVEATARGVRLTDQNLAHFFMSMVELGADSIMQLSSDPAVDRAALEWKVYGIPAFQRAMYQVDPLVAFTDGWALVVQMREYYEDGPGRSRFGPHQEIALEGIRSAETLIDSVARTTQPGEVYEEIRGMVTDWAADHPLNDLYLRQSIGELVIREMGQNRPEGLGQLGTLTEFAWDAQEMGLMLATYLPKEARWQAELLLGSLADTARIAPILAAVDSMATLRAVTTLLERTPELIATERAALFREVAEERLAILQNVEAQRIATLDAMVTMITQERTQAIREISELIAREREAIAEMMTAGREATVLDAEAVIDHLVWRVVQALAVLLLLAGALALVLLRRRDQIRRGDRPAAA